MSQEARKRVPGLYRIKTLPLSGGGRAAIGAAQAVSGRAVAGTANGVCAAERRTDRCTVQEAGASDGHSAGTAADARNNALASLHVAVHAGWSRGHAHVAVMCWVSPKCHNVSKTGSNVFQTVCYHAYFSIVARKAS